MIGMGFDDAVKTRPEICRNKGKRLPLSLIPRAFYRQSIDNTHFSALIGGTVMFSQLSYATQKKILIIAFMALPLALLFTFSYLPLFNMLRYSFHEWNGYSKTMKFVGLENYVELFTRSDLFSVFKVSLYYFGASFVQLGLALYFATILSFKTKGANFFIGVLFFPYLMNGVAISFIFLYFFRPGGTLDSFLNLLGMGGLI